MSTQVLEAREKVWDQALQISIIYSRGIAVCLRSFPPEADPETICV